MVELATELDSYHVGEDEVENIEEYTRLLDQLDDANADLQEAGNKIIERLEEIQEQLENIDAEDPESNDYDEELMKYTGDYNTRCPLCNAPITIGGHPVVIRINLEVSRGYRVCPKCFRVWSAEHSKLQTERSLVKFEQWLVDQLNKSTAFACPTGHEIKGFWFGAFENGPLGLVVNYSTKE